MFLDHLDPNKVTTLDIETISYDDSRGGLDVFSNGKSRMCGISICQDYQSIYLPIRHRTDIDGCLPFEPVINELINFGKVVKCIRNVNIKFDLHGLARDGIIFPVAKIEEVQAMARIVNCNMEDGQESLEHMANTWNNKYFKAGTEVKDWLKKNNTKDYGAVPIDIMRKYACLDTLAAHELGDNLLKLIPEESIKVYEEECKFTRVLFECEEHGIPLNPLVFKIIQYQNTKEMSELSERMSKFYSKMTGGDSEFNPNSSKQVARYFELRGIAPVKYNLNDDGTRGNPSWDKDAIALVVDSGGIGDDIARYKELSTATSTFAIGWLERAGADNRIHPGFIQSGTKTGRVSSRNPNAQNPPDWVWDGVVIPEGCVGLKYDYSQIQYRCFAHYAEDEAIYKAYESNPKTDYHQLLADRLGLSKFRDPIKTINFSFLFGMGKSKTIRKIAKLLHDVRIKIGDENFDQILEMLVDRFNLRKIDEIAIAIYEEYHRLVPAAKSLVARVKEALRVRGYIRNYFGRRYYLDVDHAYVGMNYICQGFEGDYVKQRLNAIHLHETYKDCRAEMLTALHDADYNVMPIERAEAFYNLVNSSACQLPDGFKIPILIDWEFAKNNWGTAKKFKSIKEIYA